MQPPRSPGDVGQTKEWREASEDISREHDRERERREGSKEKARSREKSWERSERGSLRKEGDGNRDGSRDRDKEQRERTVEREKTSEGERENKRRSRECYEEELPPAAVSPFDGPAGRRRVSVDEWEERRSEDRAPPLPRRPRTPLESPLLPPSESPISEEGAARGINLPPPILSDEMEAISDDEDIPDLPAGDEEGVEFAEEPMEEEESLALGHAPLEEGKDLFSFSGFL